VAKPLQSREPIDSLLSSLDAFLDRPQRRVVIVDSDAKRRKGLVDLLTEEDLQVVEVPDDAGVVDALRDGPVDCLVVGPKGLNVDPPAITDAIGERQVGTAIPIICFGESEVLAEDSSAALKHMGDVAVVRRVHSPERLLDQINLILHRPLAGISECKRVVLEELHQSNKSLSGKKVLIVDDDMRNIFALSTVLEEHQMHISSAINGRDAIETLRDEPDTDVVLMDIMMPDMDGFETMREIRKIPDLRSLPIIAVTAKAMKGDRERCIEAGAWDYLSKPVDPEQMLAVLRSWLHR
jgi:CheY-like chemotaxis protein